jgi:hypothetical protein
MKTILLFLSIICTLSTFAQSKTAKGMLAEIEGQYEVDELGYITYSKVIEVPNVTRDEMYNRAQNYFVYRYGSGKSVIQTQDKEKGTIVGHGIYPKVFISNSVVLMTQFDVWHILRVDIKEGRARVVISLTEYETWSYSTNSTDYGGKGYVSKNYPFNEKGLNKTQFSKAFAKSHEKVQTTFSEVERALKEGLTGEKHEKEDW